MTFRDRAKSQVMSVVEHTYFKKLLVLIQRLQLTHSDNDAAG